MRGAYSVNSDTAASMNINKTNHGFCRKQPVIEQDEVSPRTEYQFVESKLVNKPKYAGDITYGWLKEGILSYASLEKRESFTDVIGQVQY